MAILRGIALVFGCLLIFAGLFWTGQGLGLIMWPKSSFMLADRQWAINGSLTALVGAGLVYLARRRR